MTIQCNMLNISWTRAAATIYDIEVLSSIYLFYSWQCVEGFNSILHLHLKEIKVQKLY